MATPPLDRLIHEPARLRLVTLLYVIDEADFVYLSSQTGLTAGNISSHMTKLEDAGYVEIEKAFFERKPRTVYRLTKAGRAAIEHYRESISEMLSGLSERG
jgi:DNA-binding MarR family transcriptional regulator